MRSRIRAKDVRLRAASRTLWTLSAALLIFTGCGRAGEPGSGAVGSAPSQEAIVPSDAEARPALSEVRAEESRLLETYRWIDREAGMAAIPIDRAIELLVASGSLEVRSHTVPADTAVSP